MIDSSRYRPIEPVVRIRRELYWFSLIVLFANIVWAISMLFIGNPVEWCSPKGNIASPMFLVFFAAIILEGAAGDVFGKKRLPSRKGHYVLDNVLMWINKISIAGFLISFFSLMISGGNPEVIDGAYYIVSHGQILREIPRWCLYFLAYCDRWLFSGGLIVFTSLMALSIHVKYTAQEEAKP